MVDVCVCVEERRWRRRRSGCWEWRGAASSRLTRTTSPTPSAASLTTRRLFSTAADGCWAWRGAASSRLTRTTSPTPSAASLTTRRLFSTAADGCCTIKQFCRTFRQSQSFQHVVEARQSAGTLSKHNHTNNFTLMIIKLYKTIITLQKWAVRNSDKMHTVYWWIR